MVEAPELEIIGYIHERLASFIARPVLAPVLIYRTQDRDDIVIVAAGNSKTGMDSIKAGEALAISYQSAEGDGALAVHSAARWFNGEALDPVAYLPKHIITRRDVDEFMPAQW